jgi:glycerate kinase
MNVLLIPDTFKESLSAAEVASAMRQGILEVDPKAHIFHIPASDGGEGFLDSVKYYVDSLVERKLETVDPLGRPIISIYLYSEAEKTAYIELAKASGLELLTISERDPLKTSTLGTGIQIRDAIQKGATTIYVGIGGSATNDAGMGIAGALGFQFLDAEGKILSANGANLAMIHSIIKSKINLSNITFFAINDVLNPLFGNEGAAYTYAKQKGATPEGIMKLDRGLQHFSQVVKKELNCDFAKLAGSGAAGGTAFGLKSFLDAEYVSGVSFMLKLARFREMIDSENIDIILTGEGCIDKQTASGKLVSGVATEAHAMNIPVVAISGMLKLNSEEVKSLGLTRVTQLYHPDQAPGYSFEHASELIQQRTRELLKGLDLQ